MIGYSKTLQFYVTILMITFGGLLLMLQILRYNDDKPKNGISSSPNRDKIFWIFEFLTVIALLICVVLIFFLYMRYIPADSPGCVPYLTPYGVVASNVDPIKYSISTPPVTYPAATYAAAVKAFEGSENGFATGFFAWDGVSIIILNSSAAALATPGAPVGTSWVFEDLNTATVKSG